MLQDLLPLAEQTDNDVHISINGILDITENTLKYHNKNIYSKLGISSRKQLLRYATLKQHQDKKEQAGH